MESRKNWKFRTEIASTRRWLFEHWNSYRFVTNMQISIFERVESRNFQLSIKSSECEWNVLEFKKHKFRVRSRHEFNIFNCVSFQIWIFRVRFLCVIIPIQNCEDTRPAWKGRGRDRWVWNDCHIIRGCTVFGVNLKHLFTLGHLDRLVNLPSLKRKNNVSRGVSSVEEKIVIELDSEVNSRIWGYCWCRGKSSNLNSR